MKGKPPQHFIGLQIDQCLLINIMMQFQVDS